MLCFDRLHSTDVENGQIIFRVISTENQKFEFALTHQMAGLFASSLQSASKHLPDNPMGRPILPVGIQPVIGPDIEPGLSIDMGGNLTLEISLPPQQLADLKRAIAQLEMSSKPGTISH